MAALGSVQRFLDEPRTVVVAGVRKDGRAHVSPNWFVWDGSYFYVSTTRNRVKHAIFQRDPRVQLLVDDSTGHRAVLVQGAVEIRQDIASELQHFRAVRDKYGLETPKDEEFLAGLIEEGRVLLVIHPDNPPESWTTIGFE